MLKDETQLLVKISSAITDDTSEKLRDAEEDLSRVRMECHRIKKAWTDSLLGGHKDETMKRYVAFQQQIVTELSDRVYHVISSLDVKLEINAIRVNTGSSLLDCLIDLRNFQIRYLNAFFNGNGNVPQAVLPDLLKKLAEDGERLSAIMETVELDGGLKAGLRDFLASIISGEFHGKITYQAIEYLVTFMENLEVTIAFDDQRDLTNTVIEFLFYINFNHNNFLQWYRENIVTRYSLLKPVDQQLFLNKQLLLMKSMPVNITYRYNKDIPSVNIQLENWLNEYIKQETFHFDLGDPESIEKLELKLTVAQMALLIRLLYEEGVFALKNIAAILRFFSAHYTSKKQENISYGSMNKLYYSGDQFTAYAVRDLLLKMVAKINKMFFPT